MNNINYINNIISEELIKLSPDFKSWKRKNITLRGIKNFGQDNGIYGSYGKGLYTVPLSNKPMAKSYGKVYYVLNAIPKNPKIVYNLNDAEIFKQKLVAKFCNDNNVDYSFNYFEKYTSMDIEMIKLGFDGLIIKGREMVNYKPQNILYFENDLELENYYNTFVKK